MNSFNFIKSTFLKLTSKTYPFGTENELVSEMINSGIFPKNLEKDLHGNYFYKIGESRTIFASHLDTACRDSIKVIHNISDQQIVTTDGCSILGADDKAGVTILLWLIRNKIPGLYYFFVGEEVGCIGSGLLAGKSEIIKGNFDRIISFDRRGTNSVITHQSCTRTCSDEFAEKLASQLNLRTNFYYKPDDTGVYTDSAEFVSLIPECTNISVGYLNEHTTKESQDLYHLNKLALACLHINWETLPTKRDISKKESKYSNYNNSYGYDEEEYDAFIRSKYVWNSQKGDYDYITKKSKKKRNRRSKNAGEFKGFPIEKGKSYYDDGGGRLTYFDENPKIQESFTKHKGIYDVFKDKFLSTDFTKEELNVVRDQYLDMSNQLDVKIYNELSELL